MYNMGIVACGTNQIIPVYLTSSMQDVSKENQIRETFPDFEIGLKFN